MTLTDFLLARIAEDERDATAIRDCESFHGVDSDAEAEVLRLSDPARVLAECEAKRGAIEAAWVDHCQIEGEWGRGQSREQMSAKNDNPAVLCYIALPYVDHPDYRQEWQPHN